MRWTRRGAKDNTLKLVWTKYYKYLVEGEEYYFKQKAYATYCDGWIDSERITKRTYMDAAKKNKTCIEVRLQEDIDLAETEHLTSIFSTRTGISKDKIQGHIKTIMAAIKLTKKNFSLTKSDTYTMFMLMLDHYINY